MRIVSLCPSLTELVFDLGRGGDLVGRTRFCVQPAGRVEAVPALGGTKNPKIDEIERAEPDLVLMNEEENRREDEHELSRRGLRCLSFFPRDVATTAEMVREIGEAVERRGGAEEIAAEIEYRAARVRAAASQRPAISFVYLIWRKPWMAAGADTYIHALLTLAGGDNIAAALPGRYPTITDQQLTAQAPDRVLLSSEPFPFADKHIEELSRATGLPRERFLLVDGEHLSWHGSRTPMGIDYAERVLTGPNTGRR